MRGWAPTSTTQTGIYGTGSTVTVTVPPPPGQADGSIHHRWEGGGPHRDYPTVTNLLPLLVCAVAARLSFRMRKRSLRVMEVCCGGVGVGGGREERDQRPAGSLATGGPGATHRFPNAVDVKLQRNSFRYFFLYRFHDSGDGGRSWGVQGPSGGGPIRRQNHRECFRSGRHDSKQPQ